MSMIHFFVTHVPKDENGMVSYDLEKIQQELPEGYRLLPESPEITVTPSGATICFKCETTDAAVAAALRF